MKFLNRICSSGILKSYLCHQGYKAHTVAEAKTAEIKQIFQNTKARSVVIEQRDPNTVSTECRTKNVDGNEKKHHNDWRLDHSKREKDTD